MDFRNKWKFIKTDCRFSFGLRRSLARYSLFDGVMEFFELLEQLGVSTAVVTDLTAQIQCREIGEGEARPDALFEHFEDLCAQLRRLERGVPFHSTVQSRTGASL